MEYTPQALAKTAGISVRTLRYYDQIGLLSPKVRMENGRGIYGVQELFTLIQILTLKDFGFSLAKIQSILNESGKYKLCALKAQKTMLLKQQKDLNKNLQLIDLMIEQSKQENTMISCDVPNHLEALKSKQECVRCFDESYAKEKMEAAFEKLRKDVGDEYYKAFRNKANQMDLKDAQIYGARTGMFLKAIKEAMDKEINIDSDEVQKLVAAQWENLKMIYPDTKSKKVYLAIRDQLCNSSLVQCDAETARLFKYMSQAMEVFAEKNFTERAP